MPELVIHIGIGKTGTSALQGVLSRGQDQLAACGVLYPLTGRGAADAHHWLAPIGPQPWGGYKKLYQELLSEIRKAHPEIVLLSSEQYSYTRPEHISNIASIFSGYDTKIVFIVRPQVQLLPSVWLQKLKDGSQTPATLEDYFAEVVRENALDFNVRISPWVNAFGLDAIRVGLYKSRNFSGDIIRQFLTLADLNTIELETAKTENASLAGNFANLVLEFDKCVASPRLREEFIKLLLVASGDVPRVCPLSDKLRQEIYSYYYESNLAFADEYNLNDLDKTDLTSI